MTFDELKKYRKYKKLLLHPEELPPEQKALLKAECEKIEKYIEAIDDIEIRIIAEQYFIQGKTFEQIASTKNYERTTVSKKLRQWIQVSHNSHF